MNHDFNKLGRVFGIAGLLGACIFLLQPVGLGNAASLPNPHRDVQMDFNGVSATVALPNIPAASEMKKEEKFTNQTNVVEYRFRLENTQDLVHLKVSAEVTHGLVRWELIDPTGAVRTTIGTTERASMDTTDIKAIKGEWLLRMTLQDATGSYRVHWVE
jgi:hypothetical protein